MVDLALSGKRAVGTYTNTDGEQIIAAYAPINLKNIHWALVVELPEKEAFARVRQLEKLFVFAMLTAIVLVVIASHYLSNFITSPLLKLTWAAERVSAGDLDEAMINTERKDEIGRLAVSFERMQRSIREKISLIKSQNKELESNLLIIRKQNDELQLANKLKDEFLATTSHELRTPLHGMIGIAEALISGQMARFQQRTSINSTSLSAVGSAWRLWLMIYSITTKCAMARWIFKGVPSIYRALRA